MDRQTQPKFSRQDIINEARSWIGTPFHHQGRLKGHGCDCLGLVIQVLNAVTKQNYPDNTTYGHMEDVGFLLTEMRKYLIQIPPNQGKIGDIIVFEWDRHPHLGFLSDNGIIHAYSQAGRKVQEHTITQDLKDRICGVFKIPDIGN